MRLECKSQWRDVYYKALVSRYIPLSIILLVMASHYLSCSGIVTPFQYQNLRQNISHNISHDVKPPSMRDPVSFIYDSFVAPEVTDIPDIPEVPEAPKLDEKLGVIQLCAMHAISLGSFIALWLPTTYTQFPAKSSDMWTIVSISTCCCCASWTVCMLIYATGTLQKLSLCLSMHLSMHLLHAQSYLVQQDPSVPIYASVWVERGVSVAQVISIK
jgi:hypothetical protein